MDMGQETLLVISEILSGSVVCLIRIGSVSGLNSLVCLDN